MLSVLLLFFVASYVYGYFFVAGKTYRGEKLSHVNNGVFVMPEVLTDTKSFRDFFKWHTGEKRKRWDEPYGTYRHSPPPYNPDDGVRMTFVNHATVYVESRACALLIDPFFSERASPFSFVGPKRHHDPYLALADIARLTHVLITHCHYDHLSLESISLIEQRFKPHYVVPLNNGQFLERVGVARERITELDCDECYSVANDSVRLLPAQHWTARGFRDHNHYLWGSFLLMLDGKTIYAAGDTGYGPHFKVVKGRYGAPHAALLPIGAYEPRWFMKIMHMNPEDARTAAEDLGNPSVMGIHFGTVQLTNEGRHDPEAHVKTVLAVRPYSNTFLVPTPENGLTLTV